MTASFVVGFDHPALPGHFPGRPIVPGVILLDEVMVLIGQPVIGFSLVRFLRPVRPGEPVEVTWSDGRFRGSVAGAVVLEGSFVLSPAK